LKAAVKEVLILGPMTGLALWIAKRRN
jgi:hypothetical protein